MLGAGLFESKCSGLGGSTAPAPQSQQRRMGASSQGSGACVSKLALWRYALYCFVSGFWALLAQFGRACDLGPQAGIRILNTS